ncbi:MAG: ubiquinol oxidase subunit II [Pseudomonadales bacterium RIFCSPLOWO2_12_60_38]|jgi:cytochrome o ubiquinol oxidase subunit 2|uniref:Ubiquinol oxidase subunit 2 n=5 Tax=Pseudomonas TaxID=286 RepID=A0A3M5VYX8_PSESX|nr:cytochrome o ubiquinol oxidase, subunit II [Pseudomonas fluorescens A506]EPJ75697.1 cytochrome o ubiquinol oxidase, subunit II [Pseudomonas sp. CFT9]EPL05977.1 cytochrome o ubiquinol oxidase, subunit II [Pseudomonas sp. CF150]ETK39738.1 ubiquinol oxidase subunit II [Pseudomonas fluorescens FH5]KTC30236.1 ubiquinol oxidase subunit II [Pseudomonas sp. ICMP 19500]KWV68843.1 Cytochrome bo(3) ubiquinol oxidase subunit 2 precursor [Pseudomonas fluorescens]MBA1254730.1 ubiquinol oxidase subunit I
MKRAMGYCLVTITSLFLLTSCNLVVFNPKGQVATDERDLIILATGLMLLVVVPVIVMMFVFAYRYRATNKKARYSPRWASSHKIEAVVWGVPLLIIIVLGWVTWETTHALDPYRPLESDTPPINVQVVATDWKWLFIYPDLGIASVNELALPVHTPVSFTVTSDAAMTSFFIPALGGQIYAMAGMQTKLHLIANETGEFRGIAANYNGPGFSDMHFTTLSLSTADFQTWVTKVKGAATSLDHSTYAQLAKPTLKHPVTYYSAVQERLFLDIVDKYEGMNKANKPRRSPLSDAAQRTDQHPSLLAEER